MRELQRNQIYVSNVEVMREGNMENIAGHGGRSTMDQFLPLDSTQRSTV